ncbi:hypothetical protein BLA60_21845 [Actinophytocola xinjiangensis]|uniref:YbaB/EbfC DNA-binding family protein n=1 Tax=Actinophytocola xinjiangensis TaxID=485602 RepID=A0A7Z1AX33_9PSEU|nr:YbaB/EbfC family nucleoid-associated protein [Actinophytocola xinjiangensis]OLF08669.1 hypothetical protein BLA60_21845 [Actinophytocola xinjiangensis]
MTEITGNTTTNGVTVEVHPGGALSSLTLTPTALTLDPTTLATTIVRAVTEATDQADRRAGQALRAALPGHDLTALGLPPRSPR